MIEILDAELRPARHLIVAFTGIAQLLGGIPFEFHKTLGNIDTCSALFVKDTGCRWYQYSEAEIAPLIERIRDAMRQTGAATLTCLGNSMGGFGALLFGAMCGADAIISFSPQTAIEPRIMRALGDDRYDGFIANIASFPYGDLLKIAPAKGRVVVCYGIDNRLDRMHAERLRPAWKIEYVGLGGAGHFAATFMRDSGQLEPFIEAIIGGRALALAPIAPAAG